MCERAGPSTCCEDVVGPERSSPNVTSRTPRPALALALFLLAAAAHAAPAQPKRSMHFDARPGEQTVIVSGAIDAHFDRELRAWLDRYPHTRTLVVRSPGGLRAPALRAAALLDRRRITMRVDGRCASACALMWAAVDAREMTPRSSLGLHSSHLPGAGPLPDSVKQRLIARNDRHTDRVLRGAGFSARIVEIGARTPPTTMSWFSPDELMRDGVPFRLAEPTAVASGALANASASPPARPQSGR